jgi:thiamine-phosphate pyrophosphorylase
MEEVEELLEDAAEYVDLLLLRWPAATARDVRSRAERLMGATQRPPFSLHDRFDLALSLGLSAVHIPERGLAPKLVRAQAPSLTLGCSRHDAAGLARSSGADYCTLGPFAPTLSKPATAPLSREEFARACRGSSVPVLALGGVDASSAADAIGVGAHGVATIRGVFGQKDPVAALRALRCAVDGGSTTGRVGH